jgi:hypothetical protein
MSNGNLRQNITVRPASAGWHFKIFLFLSILTAALNFSLVASGRMAKTAPIFLILMCWR